MADIVDVLLRLQGELGSKNGYQMTHIQPTAGNVMINCPYHGGGQERNPSFGILMEPRRTAKGTIPAGTGNCFACGAKVSLSKLVKDTLQGESEVIGEEWLKANFGLTTFDQIDYIPKLLVPQDEMNLEYVSFQQYHPYMAQRGLTEATSKLFSLGFDEVTNSLIIPIKDKHGVCRMLIRRNIYNKRFHNTKGADKERLMFGIDILTYNLGKLKDVDTVWVVESAIDAMLLWQNGHVALATMQAIPTEYHIDALKKMHFSKIVIATDNDDAGENGCQRYVETLRNHKDLYRVVFPTGTKDIGDFTPQQLSEVKIYQKTKKPVEDRCGRGILSLGDGLETL